VSTGLELNSSLLLVILYQGPLIITKGRLDGYTILVTKWKTYWITILLNAGWKGVATKQGLNQRVDGIKVLLSLVEEADKTCYLCSASTWLVQIRNELLP